MWRQEDTLKWWVQQFNTAGVYLAYLAVVLCNSLQEKLLLRKYSAKGKGCLTAR